MNIAAAPTEDLSRRRVLPPGACWENWAAADGASVRAVRWQARDNRPTIIFLNGRADFIEKYAEAYWHWTDRGYGVMTFDWRGQGLSERKMPRASMFETWLGDLAALLRYAAGGLGARLVLAGHSMGGHLALRYLIAGPDVQFERALLFAPMVGIQAAGMPTVMFGHLARGFVALGSGGSYAPSQGPYGPRQRRPARQRLLTSDAGRFADETWWIEKTPELALGGATWRWISEAVTSCHRLSAPGGLESVSIPVDIFIGSEERLVDVTAAAAIAPRLSRGHWHVIAGAAHELLRERSELQDRLYAELDSIFAAAM